MRIIEVTDRQTKKDFHNTARILYRKDKNHICPLDIEIENIFNPSGNRCFEYGEAARWILKDDNGAPIGRIAAFYDKRKAYLDNCPTGGIGFFESADDKKAAFLLFDTAKEWLKNKGMEAMNGPINFGENFIHWGLLVEGFYRQGYGMPYNHRYYQKLYEDYGFKNYFEQYTYEKDLSEPWPERQEKFARHVGEKPNFTFEHFRFSNTSKYINAFVDIFNKVWSDFHADYTPLVYEDIERFLNDAKPVLKEEFIWFAYDEGVPVAMIVAFPDVNQILIKLNGKLTFLNKIRFFYYKKTGAITRARHLLTGCIPSHQRTYIIGALFLKMVDSVKQHKIKELEMSWVGDYNTGVTKIYEMLGLQIVKKHITYRYLFNPDAEFVRFTNEQEDRKKKSHITDQ